MLHQVSRALEDLFLVQLMTIDEGKTRTYKILSSIDNWTGTNSKASKFNWKINCNYSV